MKIIKEKLENNLFLIAVHRGSSMGNVVENTIPAFHAGVQSGSDILEIDIIRSTDGKFYIFHDGNEKRLLGLDRNIKTMDSSEIDSCNYRNNNGTVVNVKVEKLEDVLNAFKGDILINLDRSWEYWDTLLPFLDQFNMEDQILLKSPVQKSWLNVLDAHQVKYSFIPIIKNLSDIEEMESYKNINMIGMEIIAEDQESPFFRDETIKTIKDKDLLIWINAIRLDDQNILYAGFDDDASIMKGKEHGWQKLVDKGADMIQTDWPSLLYNYREKLKLTK
ncbi:glycerophosphodiester phosphodiesterase family protein [Metabacillus sediminilitoris]|uniref:Glycerophosphodiester phosphodiesterase family protein n=1 Tax=Metabacillus sediminilitoris TaxID=2567941 RepID=A0A4S4BNC2_9BACI|nr:glycerophosphodiester phosphodiesterase family protein [Metabacillus sediminilitoris]QGQ48405.1 glycerophosphodiester phosphodiesterase [Metabacillus sediminilitoris]THF76302.1 glycerophosphodiester phosphodiesterase family protein [Metabacillus sediminilitoris]